MTELYNFIRAKEEKYPMSRLFDRNSCFMASAKSPSGEIGVIPDWYFVGDIYGKQSSTLNRMSGYGIHARGVHRRVKSLFDRMGYILHSFLDLTRLFLIHCHGYPIMAYYISTPYPEGMPYFLGIGKHLLEEMFVDISANIQRSLLVQQLISKVRVTTVT